MKQDISPSVTISLNAYEKMKADNALLNKKLLSFKNETFFAYYVYDSRYSWSVYNESEFSKTIQGHIEIMHKELIKKNVEIKKLTSEVMEFEFRHKKIHKHGGINFLKNENRIFKR